MPAMPLQTLSDPVCKRSRTTYEPVCSLCKHGKVAMQKLQDHGVERLSMQEAHLQRLGHLAL